MAPLGASSAQTRLRSVTLAGWLFVAVGSAGLVVGMWQLGAAILSGQLAAWGRREFLDHLIAQLSRVMSLAGGGLVLRGVNWGRWLLAIWMAAHVLIGAGHSRTRLVTHAIVMVAGVLVLFNRRASGHFTRADP